VLELIFTTTSIPTFESLWLPENKLAIISLVFNPAFSAKVLGTTSKASPNLAIEY